MKPLTFVIIGGRPGVHAKDLMNVIVGRGHRAVPVKMKQITFAATKGKCSFNYKDFNVSDGDIFLFRGGYRTVKSAVMTLAHFLQNQEKTIINDDLGKSGFWGDKVFQASVLAQHGIPHPKTMQALSLRDVSSALEAVGFPIIAKPMFGSKGRGIKKFITKQEAMSFLRKNNRRYFIQEYLPIDGDFRLFVVGHRVVAGMKRYVLPGDFRSNASLGARVTKISVTKTLRELALKATQAMDYEVAGVDIVRHKGRLLVLEVNSAPQWKKLKEVTSIDPSVAIVDYALRKHKLKLKREKKI